MEFWNECITSQFNIPRQWRCYKVPSHRHVIPVHFGKWNTSSQLNTCKQCQSNDSTIPTLSISLPYLWLAEWGREKSSGLGNWSIRHVFSLSFPFCLLMRISKTTWVRVVISNYSQIQFSGYCVLLCIVVSRAVLPVIVVMTCNFTVQWFWYSLYVIAPWCAQCICIHRQIFALVQFLHIILS